MSHRYQVKFQWEGSTLFGIVDSYSDSAKRAARRGNIIIQDAVLPVSYEVKEDSNLIDIPMEIGRYDHASGDFVGGDEYHQYVQDQYNITRAASNSLPTKVVPGKMFKIGVADGYACYVVVKTRSRLCDIEWRGFCLDRYHDHHFGSGGRFKSSDVLRYIKYEDGMRKLFSKKGNNENETETQTQAG